MTRIVKNPQERRNEILNMAEKLFTEYGVDNTSVNMIVKNLGIAKGTIYHYFKSKDDIMQAVLERYVKNTIVLINERLSNNSLNAIQKFELLILEFMLVDTKYDKQIMEYLHKNQNAAFHQESLVLGVINYSKIIEEIIIQGVNEGFFDVKDTKLTAQFLMSGISFLYDIHLFGWNKEEFSHMIKGLKNIIKRLLNTKEEYFSALDIIGSKFTN